MNLQEYIQSGVLEQYAAGLGTEAERAEVERMLAQYSEVRQEYEKIEAALHRYSQAYRSPVSDDLKQKIMQRIEAEASQSSATQPDGTPRVKNTAAPRSRSALGWLGVAALLAIAAAAYLYQQTRELRAEQVTLLDSYEQLQDECNSNRARLASQREQLAVLRDPNATLVRMEGLPEKAPNAVANVYYNPTQRQAYLDVTNLPTPAVGKQYQLWAIVDGQDPISLGVFDLPGDDTVRFKSLNFVENVGTFAVTLEQAGGSPTPTLSEMYVAGTT